MVNQSTFQVCDHLDTAGNKVWWKFTYNEGLMIGAGVELYEATGNLTYLNNAHSIANFMVNNEIVATAYGNALHDGDNSGCGGDCHQFKAPAYRYLMRLYRKNTTKVAYYNVLKASADAIWNLARETTNTVFAINWAGPAQTNVDQGQENAAVAALNLWAKQSGAYPGTGIPANQYEAENATVRHIGSETNYGSFTGWAYLAGWNANGQSVDFRVFFPTPGGRTLTFRYAAGAGNASRAIAINGTNTFPNQAFASTGSWSSYNNLSVSFNFPAGWNTVSVAFNSALGNANYLNLDNLVTTDLRITDLTISPPNTVQLKWSAISGLTYRVQFSKDITSGVWSNLGSSITATGTLASATDALATNATRYYRIRTP